MKRALITVTNIFEKNKYVFDIFKVKYALPQKSKVYLLNRSKLQIYQLLLTQILKLIKLYKIISPHLLIHAAELNILIKTFKRSQWIIQIILRSAILFSCKSLKVAVFCTMNGHNNQK